MADQVTLLDFWANPIATRVRIALALKGIEYEPKEEDIHQAQRSPILIEMNPVTKQVTVLIHNGKPICDSLVIVQYIDEVWSHKSPLLPSDPSQRAHARFWADVVDKKINSLAKQIWTSTGEAQEEAKKEYINCYKLLEEELGDKSYFGGETFGFVDLVLVPSSPLIYTLEQCANFSMAAECPKIVAWTHRCMEMESVSKSLPDLHKITDFLSELKKKREDK
ncbi:probable glutathione S-transferase parA [Actinidia eriantha]|uniref:probable glutathione S-transferase parA n=1 Tax=Actinidia eriantha TaxID=165200 RepID=UPI00258BF945|nr:probable glutathione S-transferase parA [Actinidia eriantha]